MEEVKQGFREESEESEEGKYLTMGRDDKSNQGQGRSGRGQGRGGRGRGRSQGSNRFSGRGSGAEINFYPHGSGKQTQTVTYATVKDNIVSYIQRS